MKGLAFAPETNGCIIGVSTSRKSNQLDSLSKDLLDFRIRYQVQVSLPVPRLHIDQPVPFLWEGSQRLGHRKELCRRQRQLASFGSKRRSGHRDEIAQVGEAKQLVAVTENVFFQMHLDFTRTVSQLEKRRLAKRAQRNDSSGHVV